MRAKLRRTAFKGFIFLLIIQQVLGLSIKIAYAGEMVYPNIKRVYIDNSSRQQVGEKMKFIVEADGDNLQYEWHVYKEEKEIQTGSYSIYNYFECTLYERGVYRLEVKARDNEYNVVTKELSNIEILDEDSLQIKSLTVDKKGPQVLGTMLNFNADAIGSALRYQWIVYKDSNEVYKGEYSEENKFNYTPNESGNYRVILNLKDRCGKVISKESEYIKIVDPVKINSVTVNKKTKQPINTTLNFTASANGYNLTYKWYIYKDGKKVYEGKFNNKNNIQYKAVQPGNYKALVYALDSFGKYVYMYSDTIMIYSKTQNNLNIKPEEFVNGKNFTSKTKNFIWVNTNKNVVYVFTGEANEWKLVKTMACTDGKASTPTIKGNFTINGRATWLISHNPKVRARYKVRIYKSYFFHSILVDPKGRVIDPRLGKSLSHGCIRLSMENAKWIYDNIKDGTGVFID